MPGLLGAAAYEIAGWLASWGVAAATAEAIATVVVDAVLVASLYAAEKMLSPNARGANSSLIADNQLIRNSVANRPIAYGRTSIGGVVVYIGQGGNTNQFLDLAFAMTGHEIDGVEQLVLDNWALTFDGTGTNGGGVCTSETDVRTGAVSTRFAGKVFANFHLGKAGDPADATLIANSGGAWDSTCTLDGISWAYVRLTWDQNTFSTGVPTIYAVIRGRKVLDPRTGVTAWSQNAAMCTLDYMMDKTYGFRTTLADFDADYLARACNDADQDIGLADGSTEKR
jgi:hypothetical protein